MELIKRTKHIQVNTNKNKIISRNSFQSKRIRGRHKNIGRELETVDTGRTQRDLQEVDKDRIAWCALVKS